MFDNNCQVCASRVLIFPSQITSLANTDHGIVVTFTCWCGTEQSQVTGNAARAARDDECRELVADLRLLGMQPRLVVADGTEPIEH